MPERSDILPLTIVALGAVAGFPLLPALALQYNTAAHSLVFIGLLPLATAIFGVLRGGERPQAAFWLFSILGAATVTSFALSRSDGGSPTTDLLMFAAILLCGLSYAEKAVLSRRLGGWQVISWALLLSLPVMAVSAVLTPPAHFSDMSAPAWITPRLRIDLQHAGRIPFLVLRPGPRWHRGRRSVAALAALLRADTGGRAAP